MHREDMAPATTDRAPGMQVALHGQASERWRSGHVFGGRENRHSSVQETQDFGRRAKLPNERRGCRVTPQRVRGLLYKGRRGRAKDEKKFREFCEILPLVAGPISEGESHKDYCPPPLEAFAVPWR